LLPRVNFCALKFAENLALFILNKTVRKSEVVRQTLCGACASTVLEVVTQQSLMRTF
jgi:hypothetical protein